jgi:hypothetical protein
VIENAVPHAGQVRRVRGLQPGQSGRGQRYVDPPGVGWAYLDAAAAKVASPVIAKYLGRLAAADVFTADNAYVMFEALRVDYGMLGPFGDHP